MNEIRKWLKVDQAQVLYVGKHGSDSNNGKSVEKAFLTFVAAITAAGTPANEAAAVTVKCFDDGEYDEDMAHVSFVNIYAPSATLKGTQTLAANMGIKARRLVNDGDTNILVGSGGDSYAEFETCVSSSATPALYAAISGGVLTCLGKYLQGRVQAGEGSAFLLSIQRVYWATSMDYAFVAGATAATAIIHLISAETTALNLISLADKGYFWGMIDRVQGLVNLYTVAAGSQLRLFAGSVLGLVTIAGGSDVRVTAAKRDNYVATTAPGVNDDVNDGYTVGSTWVDVTLDDAYMCLDSTATAAVWKKITP